MTMRSATERMTKRIAIALLMSLLVPGIALAHHSRAEFTDEVTEIEGVLTNVFRGH